MAHRESLFVKVNKNPKNTINILKIARNQILQRRRSLPTKREYKSYKLKCEPFGTFLLK